MGVLRNIAIGVFVVSFITFVALFGRLPALRKTPIGWLQRLLCLYIPSRLRRLDTTLTGGQLTVRSRRLGNYLFYEKNPIVLILFLFLLTGSATLFLWNTVTRLPTHLLIPIPLLLPLPYIFTYLSVTGRAHNITPATLHARMHDYPYDHILFHPATFCRTCAQHKPARSKHCSLCGVCVAKADHHCPWVNNCLGRGNYRYFLAVLLTIGLVQLYGAYLSWVVLAPQISWPSPPSSSSSSSFSSMFSKAFLDNLAVVIVAAVNAGGISVAGVGALAASTAILPLALLAYHAYLIWAGMTTNESSKWGEWKEDAADGYAFRASRADLRDHLRLRRGREARMSAGAGRDAERRKGRQDAGEANPALDGLLEDEDEEVPWPMRSDQILVRTNDGCPPIGQEALWARVRGLEEVVNIYDLGGWRNLMEVLRGR